MCLLLLLGLFNPVVDSLWGLQQASELEKVQQRLNLGRASLGSLSESSRVFDAKLLNPIVFVTTTLHTSRDKYRGRSTGPGSDGILRIATPLLDVPAEIIGLIYRFRWTMELCFRFFKQIKTPRSPQPEDHVHE